MDAILALMWRILVGIISRRLVDVVNMIALFYSVCSFLNCILESSFSGTGG